MNWSRKHSSGFERELRHLKFQPRPVRVYQIATSEWQASTNADCSWSAPVDLTTDEAMSEWFDNNRMIPFCPSPVPVSATLQNALIVLASKRAPLNEFEIEKRQSWNSLSHVGFSEQCFRRLFTEYGILRSFPHTLSYHTSWYSTSHPETGAMAYSHLGFDIRTSRTFLRDLALSLYYHADTRTTIVILQGCDAIDYKELDLWLELMKDSAGHPLLMVAIFFELHYRRFQATYETLKIRYVELDGEVLDPDKVHTSPAQDRIDQALELHAILLETESELVALRGRLARFMRSLSFVQDKAPSPAKSYLSLHGGMMTDRLLVLGGQIEILQVKATNVRQSVATLTSAMWNLVAISENKICRQISIASKRDSTIMIGIAVGTMVFLPMTAVASIFAMPFLPWNVPPGSTVHGHPLLIYLALSLPLTVLTLTTMIIWMVVIDYEAKTSHLTLKPGPKKFFSNLNQHLNRTRASQSGPANSKSATSKPGGVVYCRSRSSRLIIYKAVKSACSLAMHEGDKDDDKKDKAPCIGLCDEYCIESKTDPERSQEFT